ncbi:Serine/threonine protein kinase [Globisporangium polare]
MFDQGDYASPLPLAPVVGRRRTRAIAQLEQGERRERFKRAAVEKPRHNGKNSSNANEENEDVNINATSATSIRRTRTTYNSILASASLAVAATRTQGPPASGEVAAATQSVRPKVGIGSSFGDKLSAGTVLERTPTKKELQSPPQIRRMKPAPQVVVPTPEKAVPASIGVEVVETASVPVTTDATAPANGEDAGAGSETASSAQNNGIPMVKPKRMPARGIAQSSSSFSNRKRMISFSPERDERPENRALALLKLQKNLKATEKLQQRLEGVGVMLKNEEQPRSAFTTPSKDQSQRPAVSSSRMLQSPVVSVNPLVTPVKRATTPLRYDTPSAANSQTLEFESDNEGRVEAQSQLQSQRNPATPVKPAPATPRAAVTPGATSGKISKQTENDVSGENVAPAAAASQGVDQAPTQELVFDSQVSELAASQMEGEGDGDTQILSSQQSEAHLPLSCSQDTQNSNHCHVVDFSLASSMEFTSTSVIEDVGLFNCDVDVEYTGGVYGEGTDGKVSAAVIGGQKVALKRAKPHEGFPEEEAKRRSAVELHYLRKVRHMQGFVQCLGLCDGIEHTCIALEVMDCKLSDYLRRYGTNTGTATSGGGSSGTSKRRFTLSLDEAKGLLRQICLPMVLLHDQVNVAHGDLACRNILLRTPPKGYEKKWEPVVKLSDFGRIKVPSTEPKILGDGFSFYKNCDVGSFGREILYRFLVGEIVPPACLETRSLHKLLQDLVVKQIPDAAKERLGPYYRLFMRCTGWGVRPSFREIYEHLDDLEYFETTENGLFPLKPNGATSQSASTADASFLSPVMDGSRLKFVSSGSKAKYETPNGSMQRTSNGAPRLLQSKSGTDGSIPGVGSKTVNLLKPRSVLRNTSHQMHSTIANAAPATASAAASVHNEKLHPRNLATSSGFTPNGRPMLLKKTPPSAGASRRSLQILSQIQHRTTEKANK